jgi:hypothetical protein
MKTIEQLYNWFYLDKESLNSQISAWPTPLWVAPISKVNHYENLEIDGEHFAFAEKNENWEIEYFHGLKNFLWIEKSYFPPVFIFDNHNHAIVFRYNIINSKKIKNTELIHIDQHSDNRENKNHLELNRKENELEKVFRFWNEKCNVWNFIPPAIESGIISKQIQIRSTTALEDLKIDKNQDYILDIDLDFCLDWIGRNKASKQTVEILKDKFDKIWKHSLWITIATSPYFLDQKIAIDITNCLLNNY